MKKHISLYSKIKHRFFLVITLLALAQNIPAWNYLTVFRNDGEAPLRLYSVDVDSLVYSKIDIDSILCTEWQVQEIWTSDSIYRIPLSTIDSIQFRHIESQKSIHDVIQAAKHVSHFFSQSKNIQELSSYIDDIRQNDLIEKTWFNGNSLFVTVRDGGTFSFSYPLLSESPKDEEETYWSRKRSQENNVFNAPYTNIPLYDNPSDCKICIINQTANDLSRTYERNITSQMEANFKSCGFNNVTIVEGAEFGQDFLNNDFYNYDIILMVTHGEYDGQRHWIYSGHEYFTIDDIYSNDPWTELERRLIDDDLQKINSPNSVSCGFIEEVRDNNRKTLVCYAKVSETGFANSKKRFRGNRSAILFNTACQSLEDKPSLAGVLINKGLGYYFGYSHSNNIGWSACNELIEILLNGYNVINAKRLLSDKNVSQMIDELDLYGRTRYVESKLKVVYNSAFTNNACLLKPRTLDASLHNGVLFGEMTQLNPTKKWESYTEDFRYGFCISKNKDMKDSNIQGGNYFKECSYNPSSHIVSFNEEISDYWDLEPGTYYYCAYVYDGWNYCFGDIKQFVKNDYCPDNNHPHMIDLGLPSGTKWACCNVGASAPEKYGVYYAWGETSEKDEYTKKNYIHYDFDTGYANIGTDISGTQYDAATVNWGAPWCMPSLDLFNELISSTTKESIKYKGVRGCRFVGTNGQVIFLPFAGDRNYILNSTSGGFYWSSTSDATLTTKSYYLDIYGSITKCLSATVNRFDGLSIRPVCK